jgi:hypothetical protein
MAEIKLEFEEIREESESGTLAATPARKESRRRSAVFAAAGTVIILAAIGAWARRSREGPLNLPPSATSQPAPFTTYGGIETSPAFSPDGNQVVFSWTGVEGAIWKTSATGAGEPRLVAASEASAGALATSNAGRLVYSRRTGDLNIWETSAGGLDDDRKRSIGLTY